MAQKESSKICAIHLYWVRLFWPPLHSTWVCLFTCVTVRTINLELIKNMTAEQFLLAFRRFIARRGKPSEIIKDNAPQLSSRKLPLIKPKRKQFQTMRCKVTLPTQELNGTSLWNLLLGWIGFMRD